MNAVIERIRALRALAASTTHEHEAHAAARQAARLAEKHRIAEAEIEAAEGGEGERAVIDREHPAVRGGAILGWKRMLVGIIAAHFGCAVARRRARGPLGIEVEHQLLLVGRPSDIEIAREAIAWLALQVATLCQARAIGQSRAYRAAWSLGCVRGIGDQLRRGQAEAREGASSTALVRLDARLAEANEAISQLGKASKQRVVYRDPDAFERGRAEGQALPITTATRERRAVRALEGGA